MERLLKSENNLAGLCLTEQALQSSVPKGPDTGATAGTSSRRCTELVGSYLAQVVLSLYFLGPIPPTSVNQMLSSATWLGPISPLELHGCFLSVSSSPPLSLSLSLLSLSPPFPLSLPPSLLFISHDYLLEVHLNL